jgi:uncharacterized protein YndB with AHSA1/START domain
MLRLILSTTINALKEEVWRAMPADEPYRQWTSAFEEGSSLSPTGRRAARPCS